jgi:hypothetical protein
LLQQASRAKPRRCINRQFCTALRTQSCFSHGRILCEMLTSTSY